jgi:hypothetical protein
MKPNFDTHAAYQSLVNSGVPEKQAEQLLETIKDSQSDLATKQDIKELFGQMSSLSLQIKGLYALIAGVIAVIVWFGNQFLSLLAAKL